MSPTDDNLPLMAEARAANLGELNGACDGWRRPRPCRLIKCLISVSDWRPGVYAISAMIGYNCIRNVFIQNPVITAHNCNRPTVVVAN